ncbi:transmembrane protein 26-like [Mixophyes fleayi]|uniref:transmembrane protein 26-like n=1 Tax=Mixophyes fleayi TaxID=3061075 RepID=UPI003F4DBF84
MKGLYCKILSALFSRLFFSIHGTIMVIIATLVKENRFYLILLTGIILLFIEMAVTLTETKKGEWKWFSPMVFLYLCTVLPSIFVMELALLEGRIVNNSTIIDNSTNTKCNDSNDSEYNEYSTEIQAMEEMLILVLVVGRWLMPKGDMNRDQLCQLLLMYIALGADILDILQLIKEPTVNTNWTVTIVGLCLFSWAIMQFTLVLTQTQSLPPQKTKVDEELHSPPDINRIGLISCYQSEVWSWITTVAMQDGPFLVYRIYLATAKSVFNDSMTFFICKNFLTVIIQVYRIILFMCKEKRKRKKFQQTNND